MVDSSAWIEFMRDTDSVACNALERLLHTNDTAICEAIAMEVLGGARNEAHLRQLKALLARATVYPVEPRHWETAAALYRTCRQQGQTVRKMVDCLIAAVAIDADLPVLHADRDFDVIARHTPLRVA
jgi:predicted nucleic acid-binding protein